MELLAYIWKEGSLKAWKYEVIKIKAFCGTYSDIFHDKFNTENITLQ